MPQYKPPRYPQRPEMTTTRPALSLLSTRINSTLFDRLRIAKASTRHSIQELVEEALTKHLDEVDPVGKMKAERLAKIAAGDAQPDQSERISQLEGMVYDLLERLGEKPDKGKKAK